MSSTHIHPDSEPTVDLFPIEPGRARPFVTIDVREHRHDVTLFFHTPAELDELILAAVAAKDLLLAAQAPGVNGSAPDLPPPAPNPLVLDVTRCDADWGSAMAGQQCIRDAGHPGLHRDAKGTEWTGDATRAHVMSSSPGWDEAPAPGDGPCCDAGLSGTALICTRRPHRGGDHVAHGTDGQVLHRWPQAPGASIIHGRLGAEHRSVRQHLIEEHGSDPGWAGDASDGAIHGKHDGLHGTTWAYAHDLPHGKIDTEPPGVDDGTQASVPAVTA